jgi:hypothetical protein
VKHILLEKWVPVEAAWRVRGLRMDEQSPDMEGSCEYFEYVVTDCRQGVVRQLGVGRGARIPHSKTIRCCGHGLIFW